MSQERRHPSATSCCALLVALCSVGCGDYAPNDGNSDELTTTPSGSTPEPAPSTPDATPPAPDATVPSCDMAATACAGDVAGTWTSLDCPLMLTGEIDMAGFGLGCTTATVASGSLVVSGTWTADAAGMFTDGTTTTGMQVVELPPECLTVSGTVTQCDRVGGPVQGSLGYESFDCVSNPATMGCTCTGTINQVGGLAVVSTRPVDEGTYTTAAGTLTTTDGRNENQYGQCVSGNALVLTLAGPVKIGTVAGQIVLQKQ